MNLHGKNVLVIGYNSESSFLDDQILNHKSRETKIIKNKELQPKTFEK